MSRCPRFVVLAGLLFTSTSLFIGHMYDILTIQDGYGIPLGHDGDICPKALKPLLMSLVDLTGVHATKFTFCQCDKGPLNKWRQLFQFWSSLPLANYNADNQKSQPTITFRSLHRLTDNVFTGNVPDPYKQFLFVTWIWPLLEAEKWFGRLHGNGMNQLFPCCPKDNLIVYCPACLEQSVNMEPRWEKTPLHLRYISGRAYMPMEKRYQHYLKTVLQLQKENQRISGNVNIQCDHIFVTSCVDLTVGEQFSIVDLAMELNLEAAPFDHGTEPNCVWSYNNICALSPNISDHWHKYHKHFAHIIDKSCWIIPVIHPCLAHLHGETAEYGWAIFNGIGPSVLQMSPGHQIDTLIIHYGDWNWRKLVGYVQQAIKDFTNARKLYVDKCDHFVGLCELYETKVLQWTTMDHSPHLDPRSKHTMLSVYSHNNNKAPTLKGLVD
ncbi:hypothetical protein BT96DRAFT_942530 [Gymnopus androsaceus JB14]|uniref:CxC2-like cysteine cluster KDZ transposase-associated domain-containing protein n=1 Tax=Gymnopus androsaceus JB14 TaxID=1447944 RepID=A0A6A4HAE9_9AGAR|nr:hypothetical protein BT96DRAFT_942530 [Gymnopus androsaceus JB14]